MKTSINKDKGRWWASYTDKEGVEHSIASEWTKNELIHTMARIIGYNDAKQEKAE